MPLKRAVFAQLTEEEEKNIFLLHKDNTSYEIGLKLGIDKQYLKEKTQKERKNKIIMRMYNAYNKVKKNPEAYGISKEEYDLVTSKIESRNLIPEDKRPKSKVLMETDTSNDILAMIPRIADKSAFVLEKKLDELVKSKSARDNASVKDILAIVTTMFDKARILNGESTQNIAIHSKISIDMSPDEALKEALKMRESVVSNYNNKK